MKKILLIFTIFCSLLGLGSCGNKGNKNDTVPNTTDPTIDITTPDVTTPEVTTPEVTTPEVTTPSVVNPTAVDCAVVVNGIPYEMKVNPNASAVGLILEYKVEDVTVNKGDTLVFYCFGSAITSNITPEGNDFTNQVANNVVLEGQNFVVSKAGTVEISLRLWNPTSYTIWVSGGGVPSVEPTPEVTTPNVTTPSVTTPEITLTPSPDIPEELLAPSIGVDPNEANNAYQILIYSFNDSDGDGFGDLKGVEQKLGYLDDLGINMIWLSPVMPAISYHAYDTLSFYGIDSKIGTLEDFHSLVVEAHKLDIKIILDMPINHTSSEHEWFKEYLAGNPEYSEYYQAKQAGVTYGTTSSMGNVARFYTDTASGKNYFAAFGPTMPDINFQSDILKAKMNQVFKYWVDLGVDGFRFDAVKHIYDINEIPRNSNSIQMNKDYFSEVSAYLKTLNPNIYLVGEVYSGQAEVLQYADTFDAEFDFETWHTGLGAVTGKSPWGKTDAVQTYDDTMVGCTNELIATNPNWIASFMTGNHDVTRAGSYISDNVTDDLEALKLYASMIMLRSGIPFIYYGDEIGMYGENKNGTDKHDLVGDSEVRLPMTFEGSTVDVRKVFTSLTPDGSMLGDNIYLDWPSFENDQPKVEVQMADENSLYNTYKALISFRSNHPAIYKGVMELVTDFNGGTIIKMSYDTEVLYVAFNFSSKETSLTALSTDNIDVLFSVNTATASGTDLTLSGRGVAVFTTNGTINKPEIVLPASQYYLVITGSTGTKQYPLTENGAALDPSFTEYYALGVEILAGDMVTLYNSEAGESWAIQKPDSYSSGVWTGSADGILCGETGVYNVYVKMKYQEDQIYFGYQS